MALTKRIRFEILRRDGNACRYCGATAPDAKLTIDHVVPIALGGSDDPDNLVTACRDCNAGKSATAPDQALVADVSADAVRWAHAVREAASLIRQREAERAEQWAEFAEKWHARTYEHDGKTYYLRGKLPPDYAETLDNYVSSGLELADIESAMGILDALTWVPRSPFAYFLGILNNKTAELHALARDLLDGEE